MKHDESVECVARQTSDGGMRTAMRVQLHVLLGCVSLLLAHPSTHPIVIVLISLVFTFGDSLF